ncbi:MAG: hypothetical protein ACOC47_06170 [Alkalispirochaetaceae bacterium]
MKRLLIIAIILLAFLPLTLSADTGVGIILGDPTGFSILLEDRLAFGVAWDVDDYLHIHGDVWLARGYVADPLGWYFGLGGKVQFFDVNAAGDGPDDGVGVGLRLPVGLQWYFLPNWELFGEIVPGVGIVPDTVFDVDGGVGVRFHF